MSNQLKIYSFKYDKWDLCVQVASGFVLPSVLAASTQCGVSVISFVSPSLHCMQLAVMSQNFCTLCYSSGDENTS